MCEYPLEYLGGRLLKVCAGIVRHPCAEGRTVRVVALGLVPTEDPDLLPLSYEVLVEDVDVGQKVSQLTTGSCYATILFSAPEG